MIIYLIREIRKLKGIKLKELSDITGLSISYLSEIENNKNCNPSLLTIMKIAKALDKKLDDICFIDDELVSLLSIQGEQKERLKHIGHFAITVKKEYWNMGIASMMMEGALEMIKETSLKVLDLEVKEDNLSAINLYKKFNFQEIGRYPQMFNVHQKYYDALLMNLYID